jgi:hypothetical protein
MSAEQLQSVAGGVDFDDIFTRITKTLRSIITTAAGSQECLVGAARSIGDPGSQCL